LGGAASPLQKRAFTAVLKGFISLSCQIFPKGTTGTQLDILARQHLWQEHKDYGHATGHGVGYFLNVHDAPVLGQRGSSTPLEPGMTITNEPGYYTDDGLGIRIENVMNVREVAPGWYGFEQLTLFPIDQNLMDILSLTQNEKTWLNAYHKQVFETISPHLDAPHAKWLQKKTDPLKCSGIALNPGKAQRSKRI
jgi:Xaa-Pro aminopeptidase